MRFPELLWSFATLPGSYLCLDTETTGLPDERGPPDILTLGLTEVHQKEIVSSVEFMIRPVREITEEARSIHGIGDDEAKTFEELRLLWPDISTQLSGRLVVIHNASFDWPILLEQLSRYGLSFPKVVGVFCSQKSAHPWAIANGLKCTNRGPSLDVLTSVLAVENLRSQQEGRHGAGVDSRQTVLVVEELRKLFQN